MTSRRPFSALYELDTAQLKTIYRAIEKRRDSMSEQNKVICIGSNSPLFMLILPRMTQKRIPWKNGMYFALWRPERMIR